MKYGWKLPFETRLSQNFVNKLLVTVFIIIGVAFLVPATVLIINNSAEIAQRLPTEASITSIDEAGHTGGRIAITYAVDGINYDGRININMPSFEVGTKITVYYYPENPADFYYDMVLIPIVFYIVGTIFTCVGLVFVGLWVARTAKRTDLLKNGRKISATIVDVCLRYSIHVNGRLPFYIICEGSINGRLTRFSSNNFWFDPEPAIINNRTISVYYDAKRPSRYLVDVEELEKRLKNENDALNSFRSLF